MDPRVARSRTQLQDALMALAREFRLDEITVADITAKAGVNRSTFYQHYADKETLLAHALQEAVDAMATDLLDTGHPEDDLRMPAQLMSYLVHIQDNAALYRRVLGDHGSGLVESQFRQHIGVIAANLIDELLPEGVSPIPVDVIGEGMAGTALGVVTAWLRRDPLPPAEVAAEWLWPMLVGWLAPDFNAS